VYILSVGFCGTKKIGTQKTRIKRMDADFFGIEDDKHKLHRFISKSKTSRTLRNPLRALRLKFTIWWNTDDTDKTDGRGFFSIEDDKHKLHRFTSKSKTLRTLRNPLRALRLKLTT